MTADIYIRRYKWILNTHNLFINVLVYKRLPKANRLTQITYELFVISSKGILLKIQLFCNYLRIILFLDFLMYFFHGNQKLS